MVRTSIVVVLCAVAGMTFAQASPPSSDELPPRTDQATQPLGMGASSLQSPTIVAGDWSLAAQNDQFVVFVKPAMPALGPDGFRRIRVRFEFAAPQVPAGSKAYQSLLVLTEYDCAKNRTRNVQATAFARHDLSTPLGEPQEGPGDWLSVVDGSIASLLMKQACPS